ncbi:hypothetical protein LOTGIDRAFT_204560 [Lottia gigantea]|uniref:Zinc finger protein 830 n=1 Tax=Lottia gigantea TaxID=225164 RepID=V4BAZ0_LOTGI|nr:hypothetical protein LOTGIDRAFT_204560 [Lottia gigantea]ESO86144.1 hypothetical protein LOTGIDRAFT_204560 [Lottia gigantea]
MSAPKKKKTISKDELRKLMKQTKSSIKKDIQRIDHPFAKYNTLGQLVCVICNTTVKSEIIWPTHLHSKTHKELLQLSKNRPATVKRPSSDVNEAPHSKKHKDGNDKKSEGSGLPSDFFESKSAQNSYKNSVALASYSSSEDEEEDNKSENTSTSKPSISALPTDFFDSGPPPKSSRIQDVDDEQQKTIADALPEGFFDDPKMDAKVRKVEYKDKMEEEWEMFQKSMKEETHVSEKLELVADDEFNLNRNIDEIDEQIQKLQEVNDLQDKKDQIMQSVKDVSNNDNSSDELDESDLNDFFDWRSKKSWK